MAGAATIGSTHVLDASAVLALVFGEAGADVVIEFGPHGVISAVNLSEVVAKMTDRGASSTVIAAALDRLRLSVAPFDRERARAAGMLRASTQGRGVSFGDRACLALGMETGLPVVTGDRAWPHLGLHVTVELIR